MENKNTGQVTFEDVPRVLQQIYELVADLHIKNSPTEPEQDPLMSMQEYQDYIEKKMGKRPARQTVYGQVFNRLIPFEKHGKFLYFRKTDIDRWISVGRQMKKL